MPEFQPIVVRVALATRVLAVARTRVEGAWAAYIDAVRGRDHGVEFRAVLQEGTKLSEDHARTIFRAYPELTNLPYAR